MGGFPAVMNGDHDLGLGWSGHAVREWKLRFQPIRHCRKKNLAIHPGLRLISDLSMRSFLHRLLRRFSPALGSVFAVLEILCSKTGWWRSVRESRPVDAQGKPLPWMTYPALAWMDQLDLAECRIFEYGAGWGTLHWAGRAREVSSVESDAAWVRRITPLLPPNVTLHGPMDGASYIAAARIGAPWDVVIIDGRHRPDCAQVAVEVLRPGGLILLDNSDWFTSAADYLRSQGLTQVDFQGFGPSNAYTWTTSAFLGATFNLQRLPASWSRVDRGAIPYQP